MQLTVSITFFAVSRAVRGHVLVYASLHTMLFSNAYHYTLATADEGDENNYGQDSLLRMVCWIVMIM